MYLIRTLGLLVVVLFNSIAFADPHALAEKIVTGCASASAYGNKFGEPGDAKYTQLDMLSGITSLATLHRTQKSGTLTSLEITIEFQEGETFHQLVKEIDEFIRESASLIPRSKNDPSAPTYYDSHDKTFLFSTYGFGHRAHGLLIGCRSLAYQELALKEGFGP